MNIKITIGLLVLIGLALVAFAVLDQDPKSKLRLIEGELFKDFDAANLMSVEIEDKSFDHLPAIVRITRAPPRWQFQCKDFADGQPVKASDDVMAVLLEAFAAVRPIRFHKEEPSPEDLIKAGLGPDQRMEIRAIFANQEVRELWLGAPLDGQTARVARADRAGPLYVVDSYIFEALAPKLTSLEDAALLPVGRLEVQRLRIYGPDDRVRLGLERDHDQWFVREPFSALADSARCDALCAAVSGLRILERPKNAVPLDEKNLSARIAIDTPLTNDAFEIRLGSAQESLVLAATASNPRPVFVRAEILREIARDPQSFRDRRLLPIPAESIEGITLERREGIEHYERLKDDFQVRPMNSKRHRFLDRAASAELLRSLTTLSVAEFAQSVDFAFERALIVRHKPRAARDPIEERIEFSAPDASGFRLVRRLREEGMGRIQDREVMALFAPVTSRFDRTLWGLLDYRKLAWLEIVDRRNPNAVKRALFRGRVKDQISDSEGELRQFAGADRAVATPMGVPSELWVPAKDRLISTLKVTRWFEADPKADAARGEPRIEIRFYEADARDLSPEFDAEPSGDLHVLSVWPASADGTAPARLDSDLSYGLALDPTDLSPFYALIDWALR